MMFICVFAHATVLHYSIYIYYELTQIYRFTPDNPVGRAPNSVKFVFFCNSYMSMLQCYNEDDKMHIDIIACLVVGYDQI